MNYQVIAGAGGESGEETDSVPSLIGNWFFSFSEH
jgi:hypothetical protein